MMDAFAGSMLRRVSGNFKAESGPENWINKVVTEFKTLKTKADCRQQEAVSFQNCFDNSLLPQESFLLLASALFLFFPFSFCSSLPSCQQQSPRDTTECRIFAEFCFEGNKKRKRKTCKAGKVRTLNIIDVQRKTHPERLKLGVNTSSWREIWKWSLHSIADKEVWISYF